MKKIALGFVVLVLLLLIGTSFLPGRMDVSVSRVIAAPRSEIHAQVEDFHAWPNWSVWDAKDSSLIYDYSGAEKGVDAVVAWTGESGPGGMTCTSSAADKGFWFDLSFGEPDDAVQSKGAITYEPAPNGTRVDFKLNSRLEGPLEKLMGVVMTPMVEEDFATNLQNIANLVEGK